MKNGIKLFEELKDCFDYTVKDYLTTELTYSAYDEAICILAASAFNFDNIFAKEKIGPELTKVVHDVLTNYDRQLLSTKATDLRLKMPSRPYEEGKSEFANYFNWLCNDISQLKRAYLDNAGKIVLATIDMICSLIYREKKDTIPAMKITEYVFLNFVSAFSLFYKEYFKEAFKELESYLFFEEVDKSFEEIRKQIME